MPFFSAYSRIIFERCGDAPSMITAILPNCAAIQSRYSLNDSFVASLYILKHCRCRMPSGVSSQCSEYGEHVVVSKVWPPDPLAHARPQARSAVIVPQKERFVHDQYGVAFLLQVSYLSERLFLQASTSSNLAALMWNRMGTFLDILNSCIQRRVWAMLYITPVILCIRSYTSSTDLGFTWHHFLVSRLSFLDTRDGLPLLEDQQCLHTRIPRTGSSIS